MTSEQLYANAREVLPGGVNSSVRLNRALGRPFYAARARGARVWDPEGREFIDMCNAHGAALLGHGHPAIRVALERAAELGYASAFETEFHEELARRVCRCVPCAEKVRFCSSGSEATLHLIRVCRAFTARKKIIRVEGHFHGYHELIYIGGHPPPAELERNRTQPFIESPGIPEEFRHLIVPIPFNDREALRQAVATHGHETALLILEPVNYNCGGILPDPGYLEFVRTVTTEAGIILFFDEIQSAFKRSLGGAQQDFDVVPDVCTIGKALGGGLPLSAFCGKAPIMDLFQPVGPVQHSGTFNAHLVPVLAGLAFLDEAAKADFFPRLRTLGARLEAGLSRIIRDLDLNLVAPAYGPRFNLLLGRTTPARRYEETLPHDKSLLLSIFRDCWEQGIYFHDYGGAPAHHGYSLQHTAADIDRVLDVLDSVFRKHQDKLCVRTHETQI